MKPTLRPNGFISAHCPDCNTMSNFELITAHPVEGGHYFEGVAFSRTQYLFNRCASCQRGSIAKVHDNGSLNYAALEEFFPFAIENAPVPQEVPSEIINELREAELCVAIGANRAASALLRSTLEKTLKASGYTTGTLQSKIDTAASDGVITATRAQRAHDEVRVLGNDVLHEEWRPVNDEEVEITHHYVQRILEDFYDDRPSVLAKLIANDRLSAPEEPEEENAAE